jgi:hypothetical protein
VKSSNGKQLVLKRTTTGARALAHSFERRNLIGDAARCIASLGGVVGECDLSRSGEIEFVQFDRLTIYADSLVSAAWPAVSIDVRAGTLSAVESLGSWTFSPPDERAVNRLLTIATGSFELVEVWASVQSDALAIELRVLLAAAGGTGAKVVTLGEHVA